MKKFAFVISFVFSAFTPGAFGVVEYERLAYPPNPNVRLFSRLCSTDARFINLQMNNQGVQTVLVIDIYELRNRLLAAQFQAFEVDNYINQITGAQMFRYGYGTPVGVPPVGQVAESLIVRYGRRPF